MDKKTRFPHFLIISAFDPLPGEGKELIRYPLLARELTKQGAQVTYVSSDFDHFSKKQKVQNSADESFTIHYVPCPPYRRNIGMKRLRNHRSFARQTRRWLKQHGQGVDAILSAWPPMQVNAGVSKWAKNHQIPFFLDFQDAWPEAFSSKVPKALWYLFFAQQLRNRKQLIASATGVISVSQDYFTTGKVPPEKQQLFQLGGNFFDEMPRELSGFFGKKIKLVLLAGSDRLPFLSKLIKQVKAMDNCKLYLIGRSKAFLPIQPTDDLRVHTSISETEKHQLLARADIGLVLNDPKLQSRMPNKLFSYLNYGMPILSNLQGGELAMLLAEKKWGSSCRADLADFSAHLNQVIESGILKQKERIFAEAKAMFDKQKIYAEYAAYLIAQTQEK